MLTYGLCWLFYQYYCCCFLWILITLRFLIYLLGLDYSSFIIHEWIHGLFFKHYSKQKVKYKFHGWAASASTPGVFYYKKSYIVIGLSPAVIINGILLIIFFLVEPARVMTFILLAMHFSGCAGDFYVVYKLRKYSKETLVEDTGVGMNLFTKQQ